MNVVLTKVEKGKKIRQAKRLADRKRVFVIALNQDELSNKVLPPSSVQIPAVLLV
jgi:archaellum biogenesis ATPase FlaH